MGLSSLSWSGHLYHVSLPTSIILTTSPKESLLLTPYDILSKVPNLLSDTSPHLGLSPQTGSLTSITLVYHHISLGLTIVFGSLLYFSTRHSNLRLTLPPSPATQHFILSTSLTTLGLLSLLLSYQMSLGSNFSAYLSTSYESALSISVHHIWIGAASILGKASHLSIYYTRMISLQTIESHRDTLFGHLSWITIFLGLHSFGLYIHNDTMYSLGLPYSSISDPSYHLSPLPFNYTLSPSHTPISTLNYKISNLLPESSTADYLSVHIHAFTIHVTTLILFKGFLYSRTSRIISDKHNLGFAYACDGPGRGGTCQMSPWDHVYLGTFWPYNASSILVFTLCWSTSSSMWGTLDAEVTHLTNGDFTTSLSINNWLRDYLWTQSAQSIPSYGSASTSGFGYLFLGSHFMWSLSLMFLFSGRGYWQEFIESLIWSHIKLGIIPTTSPRALSITHGRLVGLTHYISSSILVTWSYLLPSILVLST